MFHYSTSDFNKLSYAIQIALKYKYYVNLSGSQALRITTWFEQKKQEFSDGIATDSTLNDSRILEVNFKTVYNRYNEICNGYWPQVNQGREMIVNNEHQNAVFDLLRYQFFRTGEEAKIEDIKFYIKSFNNQDVEDFTIINYLKKTPIFLINVF